jgi:hypothetical protein
MANRLIKTITHADGRRRVLIVERSDGHYEYEEEKYSDDHSRCAGSRFHGAARAFAIRRRSLSERLGTEWSG